MELSKLAIRAASMLFNCIRLRTMRNHQRRVRQARRALRTLQAMQGEHAEARLFAYLRKVDPLAFKELVLCALEHVGAFVVRNMRYTGDGGLDGRAWVPGGGWCAIQIKRYGAHISHEHVAAFGKTLSKARCDVGLFIHTGRTGAAVYQHLLDRRIVLVSGRRLISTSSRPNRLTRLHALRQKLRQQRIFARHASSPSNRVDRVCKEGPCVKPVL